MGFHSIVALAGNIFLIRYFLPFVVKEGKPSRLSFHARKMEKAKSSVEKRDHSGYNETEKVSKGHFRNINLEFYRMEVILMSPLAVNVSDLLETLEEEDYNAAIKYIQFLAVSRKQQKAEQSKALLQEINGIFSEEDKGWASEEEMIKDLAEFRRERQGL